MQEEFEYFRKVALPGLLEYFKTLREPIDTKDMLLMYMADVVLNKTFMSSTCSNETYELTRFLVRSDAYQMSKDNISDLFLYLEVIPDLLRKRINVPYYRNFYERPSNIVISLQQAVVNEILPAYEILRGNKRAEGIFDTFEEIQQLKLEKSEDIKKLEMLVTNLYNQTWSFITHLYRDYPAPLSNYVLTVSVLFMLLRRNPELLKPSVTHYTDSDLTYLITNISTSLEYKEVDDIKNLVKSIIYDQKWDDLERLHNTVPSTLPDMIAYSVLLQPLFECNLLNKRHVLFVLSDSVWNFIRIVYGTESDDVLTRLVNALQNKDLAGKCDVLLEFFDNILHDLFTLNSSVSLNQTYLSSIIPQFATFSGTITKNNDIIWILPRITKKDDVKSAIGIQKTALLEKLHELGTTSVFMYSNILTPNEFVNALFGPENEPNEIATALRNSLKKYKSNAQQLILALSDLYVTNKQNDAVVDFVKRIIELAVYTQTFFWLYTKDAELALSTLVENEHKTDLKPYLEDIQEYTSVIIKNSVKYSSFHAAAYNAYWLSKVCSLKKIGDTDEFVAGIYFDPLTEANGSGSDYRLLVRSTSPTKEYISVRSISSLRYGASD